MTKEDLVRKVTERSRIHLDRSLCLADVEAVLQALKDVAGQELAARCPCPGWANSRQRIAPPAWGAIPAPARP